MRRNKIAGLLISWLLFLGFSLSSGFSEFSLVRECRSADFSALNHQSDNTNGKWERELATIINQERIRHGLPLLDLDENLSLIARDHSHDMAQQGFISHDQPQGNLQTRLNRAGYLYVAARENVASARSVDWAHNALMESPAHKKNILATDVTKVGIGIARYSGPCDEYLYITEIFAAPRKEYEPSMVQDLLVNRVNEIQQQGGGTIDPDPLLAKLAFSSLQSLKDPYDKTELQNLISSSMGEWQENSDPGLSRLEVTVQLLHNPENLSIPASARAGLARTYGSAVRRVVDNRNQPAFLVLTLLGITR